MSHYREDGIGNMRSSRAFGKVSAELGAVQHQQDPDGSKELADDEAIQHLLDATAKVRNGFPRTAWGLRSMLASVGLIIVKSPDGATKR